MKEFSGLKDDTGLSEEDILYLYDDLPLWSAPFGLRLLDTVIYKRNIRALDVGSGAGFPLIELAQRLGNTSEVIGIDPWQTGIDKIKKKIELLNLRNVKIIRGNAESLPFDSGYFDLIVSNNGINNVDCASEALKECRRVSLKNAQFVMTVNLPGSMIEFYKVYIETVLELGLSDAVLRVKEHIKSKRKSLSENIELVESSGFKVDRAYEDSFQYKFSDGSAFLSYLTVRVGFMPSWKNISPENNERIFSLVEKKLNKMSENKGFLEFNIPYVCINSRAV